MSLFFFGNNFYKYKETFKIFLHSYWKFIEFLVETILESMMFFYTFSVTLLYDSTAAT